MAGQFDVHVVTIPIPDPGGDNKQIFLFKAPLDAVGGCIRLVGAYAVNGAATGAGTSFSYALHKYSSAGTPAVNGTIAAAIGGTAGVIWADAVPKAFTLSDTYAVIDAGEWIVLDYQEDNTSAPTNSTVVLQYVMGK